MKRMQVLRMNDVIGKLGMSRSTIYERINPASKRYDATFPKPFKLGLSAIGWLEQDIDAWLKAKSDNCG